MLLFKFLNFHDLSLSSDIKRVIKSRTMGWVGLSAQMGTKNADKMLFAKSEGKRQHEKLMYRWEGNTGTDVRDRECQHIN